MLPKRTTIGRHAGRPGGQRDQFGQPFGRAHDAAWRRGLVGRDEHEARAGLLAGRDDVGRAEHVGADGRAHVAFHHRHVLVGGGVEDDVRGRARHRCGG